MANKLKKCPACEKEVAKSAKICPHCGKKLKMGFFKKIIIGLLLLFVLGVLLSPTAEEKAKQLQEKLELIENSTTSELRAEGELGELFNMGSDNTDIQRENAEKKIIGQIVEWSLKVYEVSKHDGYYRIQTQSEVMSSPKTISAFIDIYPRNEEDKLRIEALKTNDIVSFKGKIEGTFMRNIEISPAILK